jgi:hypothetical protein
MRGRSAAQRLADAMWGLVAWVASNALSAGIAATAATLLVLFFVGLSILSPSSPGQEVRFSDATSLIATRGALQQATLRDQDARLELTTSTGQRLWASYPHADAYTSQLLDQLRRHHVATTVDSQTGKPTLRAVVQFLLPILILATLFAMFTLLARAACRRAGGLGTTAGAHLDPARRGAADSSGGHARSARRSYRVGAVCGAPRGEGAQAGEPVRIRHAPGGHVGDGLVLSGGRGPQRRRRHARGRGARARAPSQAGVARGQGGVRPSAATRSAPLMRISLAKRCSAGSSLLCS